jgi:hypothetical protein
MLYRRKKPGCDLYVLMKLIFIYLKPRFTVCVVMAACVQVHGGECGGDSQQFRHQADLRLRNIQRLSH